jgi:HEPN domain-containing protein
VNRRDFKRLADDRLRDARVLLAGRRYSAAYYLAGYAVECGLKACIARQIRQYEFPRSAQFSRDVFTHDLTRLVILSELNDSLDNQTKALPRFGHNWSIVAGWSEQSRYQIWTKQKAQELLDAVSEDYTGVLAWIRGHW